MKILLQAKHVQGKLFTTLVHLAFCSYIALEHYLTAAKRITEIER